MSSLKRNRKALLCLALVICTIASIFAVMAMPAGAAEEQTEAAAEWGETFSASKYYQLANRLPDFSSYTFETEFYLDPSVIGNGRAYNLIGNWKDGKDANTWNIELHNYGSVRLMHTGKHAQLYFGSNSASNANTATDIRTYMKRDENGNPIYVRMTITVDTVNGNAYLYVDGKQVGKIENNASLKGMTYVNSSSDPHRIGLDYRSDTNTFFKGSIRSMAMYSYARSAEQISNSVDSVDSNDDKLMFAYNLANGYGSYLADISKNNNNATNPNWKIDTETRGRTFTQTDNLLLSKNLTAMPQTFEAVIYAPTSIDRTGIIFGNYEGDDPCLNFELHNGGSATIHLDPTKSDGPVAPKLGDVRSNSGFVHVAVVRESVGTNQVKYTLYVDGQYKSEQTVSAVYNPDIAVLQSVNPFKLGGDFREFSAGKFNERYFKGTMKNVALYSTPLTAEEVLASYKSGVGTVKDKDNGLILNYDMTVVESPDYVKDVSGNGYHATKGGVSLESFTDIGRTFSAKDELYLEKSITAQPQTYEAWILAPKDPARTGVMIGNYGSGSTSLINFEIHNNGAPSVYIQNENGDLMQQKFNYAINDGKWNHVVITHEYLANGGARFTCYVNGTQVDTFDTELSYKISNIASVTSLSLGRDSRGGNGQYFKGRIKNVALYSDVLTPAEIAASYENGVNKEEASLMLYYDLQGTADATQINDLSKNKNNAHSMFYENQKPLTLGEDYAYSFVVVGDTQKLVDKDDATKNTTYTNYIYDWIVKNKSAKNIQFVMGLGDITENNTYDPTGAGSNEWIVAKNQILKLASAGIKYSLVPGNHDGPRTYGNFNTVFGTESSLTNNISGYMEGTDLSNYYMCFKAGSTDYMVVVLEYGPTDDVLTWAGNVIKAHPNHKVIITTHAYMYRDGTTLDINDVVPPREETKDVAYNNGDQMWTKLVSQYDNIIMSLGGHDPYANISWRQDLGVNGNTVTQMLVDFQGMDLTYEYKTGMVAVLYFSADGKSVKVEYISTYNTLENQKTNANSKDVIYNAYANQFEFTIPEKQTLSKVEVTINGVGGYFVDGKYSNEITYPFVVFKQDKTFVGGYGDLGAATAAAKAHGGAGNYVILMRRDAEQNIKSDGLANMSGSITIDLGGHTLYKCQTGYIFDLYANDNSNNSTNANGVDVRGTYVLQNGTVISYSTLPIVGINYGSLLKKTYSVTVKFDGITFVNKAGEYHILATWEDGYKKISQDQKQHVQANVEFNNCTFDYKNSIAGTQMIDLTNVNGYDRTVYNVVIKGGKIISNDPITFVKLVNADGNANGRADKVTFVKDTAGNYITEYLPASVGVAAIGDYWLNSDGKKYIMLRTVDSDGAVVYTLSADDGKYGTMTQYGFISSDNKSVFLIFDEYKNLVGVADTLLDTTDPYNNDGAINIAKVYMQDNTYTNGSYGANPRAAFIVMTRDYKMASNETYHNLAQVQGVLTIDLNRFKLSAPDDRVMFSSAIKPWTEAEHSFPTEFRLINGTVEIVNKPLIEFSAWEAYGKPISDKAFVYRFDNVNINVVGNASTLTAQYTPNSNTPEAVGNPAVQFNDCTINIANAKYTSGITLFDLGNGFVHTSITVNGGEIITGANSFTLFKKADATTSSLIFGKTDGGNYTAITVPKGTTLPTTSVNGGELVFVKVSESTADGTETYRLRLAEISDINYSVKTSITLDSQLVINAYVPVESTVKFTFGANSYENLSDIASKIVTLNDGKKYYLVSVALPSAEAAEDVKLVATVSQNNKNATVTFTLSVPKYAEKVLKNASSTPVEKTLVKDVLSYVKAAYNYFTDFSTPEKIASVNAIVNELLAVGGAYDGNPSYDKDGVANTELISSAALVLDEKPTIRFYVKNNAQIEFYIPNAKDSLKLDKLNTKTVKDANGNIIYVELDVYAYALSELITYKSGDKSGTYCLYDYLYQTEADEELMAQDNADALLSLIISFIKYTESAAEYKNPTA